MLVNLLDLYYKIQSTQFVHQIYCHLSCMSFKKASFLNAPDIQTLWQSLLILVYSYSLDMFGQSIYNNENAKGVCFFSEKQN